MSRHKVKPGFTGWAQVNGWRGETDAVDKMQKRVGFCLHYIRNWPLWLGQDHGSGRICREECLLSGFIAGIGLQPVAECPLMGGQFLHFAGSFHQFGQQGR